VVGRSCRTRGPSGGITAAAARGGAPPAPAFESLNGRADALYVVNDALIVTNRIRINTWALAARLPTMHGTREVVEAGGLISYGPKFPYLFRRAADYVDKIMRGAKPGDIPVDVSDRIGDGVEINVDLSGDQVSNRRRSSSHSSMAH